MRPVCVKCQRYFKIKRNGVVVEEGMPTPPLQDGKSDRWVPYKLYMADLYECERCKGQLAITSGHQFSEHFEESYRSLKEGFQEAGLLLPMVEDC